MANLGTKADTLKNLYQRLTYANVLPQFTFTVEEWEKNRTSVLDDFYKLKWSGKEVIVRSSSLSEDTLTSSQAGKYDSIANVHGCDALEKAVCRVILSYQDENKKNQVLIQPMLNDVQICGVAFTLDPNTSGNYYVVNYDKTGSTDAITSGCAKENLLYYHFKGIEKTDIPPEMQLLIPALEELESFFFKDNLDVEFAITGDGTLFILQVRALCMDNSRITVESQYQVLNQIASKIRSEKSKKPFLCGSKVVYSVMTDWNPAEMIGIRPKPLAMSLYREIITDSIWAYQRDNYGYRNLRSFPLMVNFCGLPYIDVRVSFNSFVPAQLNEQISEKLVDYYLDRLLECPDKHDKAEFEIVFSCYTLDLPQKIKVLESYGFLKKEIDQIIDSLRDVTNRIIDYKHGEWRKDYDKIKVLERRYEAVMDSSMGNIEKVYWLIEDCKRYGTLPFAGLARAAFIAVQMLQSLVICGILSQTDYELFMSGLSTVSSNMNADFKELSRKSFLEKYGHLRPGTYDMNSLRYDEAPDLYFDWIENSDGNEKDKGTFRLSLFQLNAIKEKLAENGLSNDVIELFDYIKASIEGREYGKFVFTKSLSRALQLIEEIATKKGINKEDCSYLNIQTIRGLYSSTWDIKKSMDSSIQQGKEEYAIAQGISLPPFIADSKDVLRFFYPDSEPNYVTSGKICADVYTLEGGDLDSERMDGKILLIPSADPGYDWIFSHGIHGFVTMYGGANSHMAIRAGELGIPAVVGVGAKAFEKYKKAQKIEIDCAAKIIRILKMR